MNTIKLEGIIKELAVNTFEAIGQLLNEGRKDGISEEEKEVILGVIGRLADGSRVDYKKQIAELMTEIEDLKQELLVQSFQLDTEDNRARMKSLIVRNNELEEEIKNLNERIHIVSSEDTDAETKQKHIIMLIIENKKLKEEVDSLSVRLKQLSKDMSEATSLGLKMIEERKKGRKKNPKIKNEEIRELYENGFIPSRIAEILNERGVKCKLQTVLNRLDSMELRGNRNPKK